MYYHHLAATDGPPMQQQERQLSTDALQLLSGLLSSRSCCPCVCSNAKAALCGLAGLGVDIPAAGSVSLVDPEVLAWLADPQLVQDCKQADCYTLQVQLERLGLQQVRGKQQHSTTICAGTGLRWHALCRSQALAPPEHKRQFIHNPWNRAVI